MKLSRDTSALQYNRLLVPRESIAQRQERVGRSLQVARQMMSNGCCANTVARYTGLSDAQLSGLAIG